MPSSLYYVEEPSILYDNWTSHPQAYSSQLHETTSAAIPSKYSHFQQPLPKILAMNTLGYNDTASLHDFSYGGWTEAVEPEMAYISQLPLSYQLASEYTSNYAVDASYGYPSGNFDISYCPEETSFYSSDITQTWPVDELNNLHQPVTYTEQYPQWQLEDISREFGQVPDLLSSANSVASQSPMSDVLSWQTDTPDVSLMELGDQLEPLQGLGLYDSPDLGVESSLNAQSADIFDTRRFSLGRGLKLEESFQFEDEDVDEGY